MKYTISELQQELNRSRPVTKKWVERKGFKSTTKMINSRELIAYELSDKELEELKHDVDNLSEFKSDYVSDMNDDVIEIKASQYRQNEQSEFIEFMRGYASDIKQYIERAVSAEAQVKLITTSESNKDEEINRLRAELKQAQIDIELLKQELEAERKKPFWKRGI